MTPENDTPRRAFDLLSWRVNLVVIVALVAVSLVAWMSTIEQANSMRGMVMGLGQIGYRGQGNMGAGVFLAMWITMMAAMMLPTIAPMVHAPAKGRWSKRAKGSERWVRPTTVAKVSFVEWTADGSIRHPTFRGMRKDKPAKSIRREGS